MGLLRWLKLARTAGTPEGCRESTRLSYDQHLRAAFKGRGPKDDLPHHDALYGALASWYKIRGMPVREALLWGELAPFLLVPEAVAREAIAEYTLYLEEREGWWGRDPAGTRVTWLADLINHALRTAPNGSESLGRMALLGVMNRAAWHDLLAPDVREPLDAEVRKLYQTIEENSGA